MENPKNPVEHSTNLASADEQSIIEQANTIYLSAQNSAWFFELLENPSTANARLQEAIKRYQQNALCTKNNIEAETRFKLRAERGKGKTEQGLVLLNKTIQ